MASVRAFAGISVVVIAVLLSIASTGEPEPSACGELAEGAAEGESCGEKSECAEVCCFCDQSDFAFRAQGCDLDNGVCYGGDVLCQLALDDDPALCASGDGGP